MIILLFLRKNQKEIDVECDKAEVTPSDYTIFIQNIPISDSVEQIKSNLIYFFEQLLDVKKKKGRRQHEVKVNIKVTKVNLTFDV